jgi:ADP-ribose pyrophosphatase
MVYDVGDHEVLSTRQVFDGKIVKVFLDEIRLPDGRTANWERVKHPGAVGIVPLDDDGNVLMVRQYRNAVRGVLLEIPAGKLEASEDPLDCARRELAEETGMKAGEIVALSEFYNSPGYSDERFFLYLARSLAPTRGESEPDEFLDLVRVGLDEAFTLISSGRLRDAKSIIGMTLARAFLSGEAGVFAGGAPG